MFGFPQQPRSAATFIIIHIDIFLAMCYYIYGRYRQIINRKECVMNEEIMVESTAPSDTDRLVSVLERISETLREIYLRINQSAPGEPKPTLIDLIKGGER